MRIRFTRATPVKGRDYYVGDEVDLPPAEARSIVEGYHAAVYVDGAPVRRPGMVVHEDPVIESRDPMPPTRRRG